MSPQIQPRKTVLFLADGMADEPLRELNGLTPLEYARTPGMDRIAREGCSGEFLSLPDGFPTGSEVANMSVLGCDLEREYGGRGPLEAAGRGIAMRPDDVALRMNLISRRDGILTDFSAGHPSQEDAETCIAALNERFGSDTVRFHTGVSYRNLLMLRGPTMSPLIITEKPDDHQGDAIAPFYPRAAAPDAEATAKLLQMIMVEAPHVLNALPLNRRHAAPVNGVWPWSGGRAGSIQSLETKFGIRGAVISAVDVIVGLGRCLGMDIIPVHGATGYIDTNYEGKAKAALDALDNHDFVYLHIEAIDEVSHACDLALKIDTIEQFDARIVQPVLEAADPTVQAVVLPDHHVPVRLGKHTRDPVPVAIRFPDREPDTVMAYGESAARRGILGRLAGNELMQLLFGPVRS